MTAHPPRDRTDACPGALQTHAAADGALARVRVPGGALSVAQLRVLAAAARDLGDGALELTSRGNVQLRGLRAGAEVELGDRLADAGLLPSATHETARNVLASVLSGRAGGLLDVRPWVTAFDAGLCADPFLAALPGRFLAAFDDGRGDVAGLGADVGLLALGPDSVALLLAGSDTGLRSRAGDAVALALDELLGAQGVPAEGLTGASLDHQVQEVADRLRAAGEVPAVLPFGGSSAVGARGYVDCARELHQQAPDAAHVVVAVGSGGTMAGLVAGLGAERVLGIDTGALSDPAARVAALVAELGGSPEALRLDRDQVGEGYGRLTAAAATAMRTAARTEGLLLDPVYTGKAIAGLASAVSEGIVRRGERTVFVHTGGLPGLFGHPFAAELAAVAIGSGRRGLTGRK